MYLPFDPWEHPILFGMMVVLGLSVLAVLYFIAHKLYVVLWVYRRWTLYPLGVVAILVLGWMYVLPLIASLLSSPPAGVGHPPAPATGAGVAPAATPWWSGMSAPLWLTFVWLGIALVLAIFFHYRRLATAVALLWALAAALYLVPLLLVGWAPWSTLPAGVRSAGLLAAFALLGVPLGLYIFGWTRLALLWVALWGLAAVLYAVSVASGPVTVSGGSTTGTVAGSVAPSSVTAPGVSIPSSVTGAWSSTAGTVAGAWDWTRSQLPWLLFGLLALWAFVAYIKNFSSMDTQAKFTWAGLLVFGILVVDQGIRMVQLGPTSRTAYYTPTPPTTYGGTPDPVCKGPLGVRLVGSTKSGRLQLSPSCQNRVNPEEGCVSLYGPKGKWLGILCAGDKRNFDDVIVGVQARGGSSLQVHVDQCPPGSRGGDMGSCS